MEAFIRGERVARCGVAAVIERRCQRSQPEAMTRGWMPERRYAEPRRGGRMLGQAFFASFLLGRHSGACKKGSRRKGETISRRYRRNGYVRRYEPSSAGHTGFLVDHISCSVCKTLWDLLGRRSAARDEVDAVWLMASSRAGSLLQCGGWLACESGVSVTEYSTEPPLSQASPPIFRVLA